MALSGKYKLSSSDNFDGYMKEIGVPDQLIAAANDPNAETSISEDGDNFVITLSASGRTAELKFTLNQEFDETSPHGVQVKTLFTKDGDKLIQTQKGAFSSVITREVVGDELVVTLVSGSVSSTRKYKRIE